MADESYDVVIVGAGFAGIHQSYRIRELGLKFLVIDQAGDVGGTWYYNLYASAGQLQRNQSADQDITR